MRFFIKYDTYQDGPFDLISMIRKIRNGELREDVLVLEEHDERAVPAGHHPKLESFYNELQPNFISDDTQSFIESYTIGYALRQGWNFFQHHHASIICSGIYLFAVVVSGLLFSSILPPTLSIISLILTWSAAFFFLGGLLLSIAQIYRGEKPNLRYILGQYIHYLRPLLAYGVITGVLSAIGGALLIIPGLIVISICIFAPLLILERQFGARYALHASKATMKRHGMKLFELVLALVAVNFIGGVFFVFPLLITLPVTLSVIVELHERITFQP